MGDETVPCDDAAASCTHSPWGVSEFPTLSNGRVLARAARLQVLRLFLAGGFLGRLILCARHTYL